MKPHSSNSLIWRVLDVLSSAVILLTIGVASAVLLQAGDITI
jgi:hypothetical protein